MNLLLVCYEFSVRRSPRDPADGNMIVVKVSASSLATNIMKWLCLMLLVLGIISDAFVIFVK